MNSLRFLLAVTQKETPKEYKLVLVVWWTHYQTAHTVTNQPSTQVSIIRLGHTFIHWK